MMEISQDNIIDKNYSLLIHEDRIKNRLLELGNDISEDYHGIVPIFVGVLNGGFIFLADLIRNIDIDCEVDFIRISSYGDEKESSGHLKILKPLSADIKGRHVILVEDILDSGNSLSFLIKMLSTFEPASLKIATLLQKSTYKQIDIDVDYIGFKIDNKYVIGFGLDDKQIKRNLRSIYVVEN